MIRTLILALAVAAAGCAPVAPRLDSRFGAGVRSLIAQQALPPQAPDGGAGFDAAAAHGAMSQYRRSFQAPAPAPPSLTSGAAGGGNAGR